ncbi:hypothetical protein F6X40_34735 [Paraburkholderia sp. UCT31]|uniref:hypothetical protein n=1 Tax=Paraburkholderia sp. UCT31 TaxID=2615209 RepID=UPI0016556ED5|nr:hypothetical protein [Paraburkholderia sp. UCT31]MBC8741719.1 hypothetical protein [Paraburkholderia sp. UCT31]
MAIFEDVDGKAQVVSTGRESVRGESKGELSESYSRSVTDSKGVTQSETETHRRSSEGDVYQSTRSVSHRDSAGNTITESETRQEVARNGSEGASRFEAGAHSVSDSIGQSMSTSGSAHSFGHSGQITDQRGTMASSIDAATHSHSQSAGHGMTDGHTSSAQSISNIHGAVQDHMLRNGMAQDVHRAQDVSASISQAIEAGHGHSGASVEFHKGGTAVATLEGSSAAGHENRIGMDVFAHVAEKGVSHETLGSIRDAAGPGHEHRSDLQLMDAVGVKGVEKIAKEGMSPESAASIREGLNGGKEKSADAKEQHTQDEKTANSEKGQKAQQQQQSDASMAM